MSLCGRAKTEVFENDYVTGIGMSQFHLGVKSIKNQSNMAGYLGLMLFALISTLIACLELNAALINLYTLILRKRQSLVTKTDVFLSVFGGQLWTVENASKTPVWTKNFLSIFKKQKTEVFKNALVWTGPEFKTTHFVEKRKTYNFAQIQRKISILALK